MDQTQDIAARLGLQDVPNDDIQPIRQYQSYDDEPAGNEPSTTAPQPNTELEAVKAELAQLKAQANPDPATTARETLTQRHAEIDRLAADAAMQLQASEQWNEQSRIALQSMVHAAKTQAQMDADRMALYPTARRQAAEKIAQEFSVGNAKIEAKELEGLDNLEAMKAVAKVLQGQRRDQKVQQRVVSGADKVEAGSPYQQLDAKALDEMSPQQLIAAGLREQRR